MRYQAPITAVLLRRKAFPLSTKQQSRRDPEPVGHFWAFKNLQ